METTNILFGQTLAATTSEYSVRILIGAIFVIGLTLILSTPIHTRFHFTKKAFFTIISSVTVATTIALVLVQAFSISASETHGIESRAAKISLSVCGQQIPIQSQGAFSQYGGSARQRWTANGELEYVGYITDAARDASLGSFFSAYGGGINSSVMTLPYGTDLESKLANSTVLSQFIHTNPLGERYLELQNGNSCQTFPSMISVYAYRYDSGTNSFTRDRIIQPENYIISMPVNDSPDCIVVVYGEPSESTNLRCGDYPNVDQIQKPKPGANP